MSQTYFVVVVKPGTVVHSSAQTLAGVQEEQGVSRAAVARPAAVLHRDV